MNETPVVLKADALSYRTRDGKALVDTVSIQVNAGEIVVLAGPNGAGKTTLLKLLAGLLVPSSGSITLFDQPMAALSMPERARRIAFVGQNEVPDKRLTVSNYVALGRIPKRWTCGQAEHDSAVSSALSLVGLSGKERDPMGQLSGGEAQRAAIARALCQEPEILFLDEPTNHLDPKAKGDLLSLVATLGITVICVLHDLSLIPPLASHVVLIDEASLIAAGPMEETLTGETVRQIFGVDYLKLAHPETGRPVSIVDIPIRTKHTTTQE